MTITRALPTTIDGVMERLEEIVRDCLDRHDRPAYFAVIDDRVTLAVREGIRRGEFRDGPRCREVRRIGRRRAPV